MRPYFETQEGRITHDENLRTPAAVGAPAILGLLVLAAGPALAVECGEVITGAARLDRDLVCTDDPALTVAGGSLNLNGFTVACDQTVVGIVLEGSGARLRNGAVTSCELAVRVAGSGNHRIDNLTASAANQCFGNTIERNQVLLNRVDLQDITPDCDDKVWRDNVFETSVSDGCVQ